MGGHTRSSILQPCPGKDISEKSKRWLEWSDRKHSNETMIILGKFLYFWLKGSS